MPGRSTFGGSRRTVGRIAALAFLAPAALTIFDSVSSAVVAHWAPDRQNAELPAAFAGIRPVRSNVQRLVPTPRCATAVADGTTCPATGRSAPELLSQAQKLLFDIIEILTSTGLTTGFSRTVQAVNAATQTAADLVREPPSSFDEALVARTLRMLFERLGSTYIKLGQFIASSPTVFPAAYVKEFQRCLDNTATISYDEVKKIVEDDLGQPISKLFLSFEEVPLASASIAQVHGARLLSGEDVVVKVQKPDISDVLQTDLGFVYIAARVLEFINPELNSRGSLADIASDLRTSMLGELDFNTERENLNIFREFLVENGLDSVAVAPLPYAEFSSKRVLTMERLRGVALVDLEGIKNYTPNPEQTLVNALNVWVTSVQRCEFFHADVHAGNLLVLEGGTVGFLDFGIVGRMPPKMTAAIDVLNEALAVNDPTGMARALISMGATTGEVDETKFAADISKLLDRLGSMDADEMAEMASGTVEVDKVQDIVLDIAQTAGNNGLKLPREFGLLIKQALYFDRYTKLLAPELDMMSDDRISRFGGEESAATSAPVTDDAVVVETVAAVEVPETDDKTEPPAAPPAAAA